MELAPIKREGVIIVVARPAAPGKTVPAPIDRDYLIIRRSHRVPAPGTFCFPGGGIEPGETPIEAAEREFREEIGVDVLIQRPIWENVTPWRVHLRWFLAELADVTRPFSPSPEETDGVFWRTLASLQNDPDFLSSNLPFLDGVFHGDINLSLEKKDK